MRYLRSVEKGEVVKTQVNMRPEEAVDLLANLLGGDLRSITIRFGERITRRMSQQVVESIELDFNGDPKVFVATGEQQPREWWLSKFEDKQGDDVFDVHPTLNDAKDAVDWVQRRHDDCGVFQEIVHVREVLE